MTGDRPARWRWTAAAALLLLNAALTFDNIWPTPAVRWSGGVSIELAAVVLALVGLQVTSGGISPLLAGRLAALWVVLAIGRYVQVTTPALYGRDVNLYWDLRFIPDVAAMIVRVAPVWLVIAAVAAAAAIVFLVHRLFRWSFRQLPGALNARLSRRVLGTACGAALALFIAQRAGVRTLPAFPAPVIETYAHQITLVTAALAGTTALPASPRIESSYAAVRGADVFVVFIESYGAVAFAPELSGALASSRDAFAAAVHETGRDVASAFVESPTFGGSSWLAHISFLSGIEVRDPDTNALLMTERRDTLVRSVARHGFETIALMPGLRQRWPEGAFYGFENIFGADQIAYRGPEFGWFAIPDQYSLARLEGLSPAAGKNRFVFFPTISTHFPFSPTPPYQPDWRRILTDRPFDGPAIVEAYAHEPDWTDFRPGYVAAMTYDFAVLGGYLREHADRDIVMILLGDHQPPAAVCGEGAAHDVPVHIVTSRPQLLEAFVQRGFRRGVVPPPEHLSKMHLLLPMILDAFGDEQR